ncbi:MAG TPA: DHHA1 domain-containing protein, partial [Pirellulaceae bacterium]|nr:DHHA1 domain-containing protein [Pirellulaceae bacterium]
RQQAATAAARLGVPTQALPEGVRRLLDRVRDLRKRLTGSSGHEAAEPIPAAKSTDDYAAIRAALRESSRLLNVGLNETVTRIDALLAEAERLEQEVKALAAADGISADSLLEGAERIGSAALVVAELPVFNPTFMRQLIDQIRQKSTSSVVVLAAPDGEKCQLLVGVSRELVDRVKAGEVVKRIAPIVGGGGGGRPDLAQAGGKDPSKIGDALAAARAMVKELLPS